MMNQDPDHLPAVLNTTGSLTDFNHSKWRRLFPALICVLLPMLSKAADSEVELLRTINVDRNPSFDVFFSIITDSAPIFSFAIPTLIMFYYLIIRNNRQALIALIAGVSIGIAALVSTILKFWIDRPRPFTTYEFIEKLSVGGSPSFPSGHTTDAFAMAVVLALIFRKWWITFPVFLWALLVGYSRMHLGVHYPSDVVAGMILGLLVGGLSFVLIRRLIPKY